MVEYKLFKRVVWSPHPFGAKLPSTAIQRQRLGEPFRLNLDDSRRLEQPQGQSAGPRRETGAFVWRTHPETSVVAPQQLQRLTSHEIEEPVRSLNIERTQEHDHEYDKCIAQNPEVVENPV